MSKAYELGLKSATLIANADLSDYQYYGVKMNTSEKVLLASTGDKIVGVLQDEPAAENRACQVAYGGISKAVGGAAISAGVDVQCDASGKFVTQTTGDVVGTAWTACGGDGQLFALKIAQT